MYVKKVHLSTACKLHSYISCAVLQRSMLLKFIAEVVPQFVTLEDTFV